jgi:RHS repeat-associated protein
MDHFYAGIVYRGDWRNAGSYHEATVHDASLSLLFYGDSNIELRMGQGPDYSIYDVYIDSTLWESFDGYAASEGERIISIPLEGTGLHLLEVKNRLDKRLSSTGYKIRFKSLYGQPAFDITTIDYTYDGLSRLLTANYDGGAVDYTYGYDLSGNLINNNGVARTYNAANQMINDGTNTLTYDDNGNMSSDGVNGYTWDRANRLLGVGNTNYKYDGLGNRIQQTVASVVTEYLNNVQPILAKALAETTAGNTTRYVHGPRGIHAIKDDLGWNYVEQDGLGSLRNNGLAYTPLGVPNGLVNNFGFTGEYTDNNGQVFLRARYYNPSVGIFNTKDSFEGAAQSPMSMNAYSWVEGNFPNSIDPTGHLMWNDQASDGRFRIEQYDCVSCIAHEVGLFNYSSWTFVNCATDNEKDSVISAGYRQFQLQMIEQDQIYNYSNVENRGNNEHPNPWIWWRANDNNNRLWVPDVLVVYNEQTCSQGFVSSLQARGRNRTERCYCGRPTVDYFGPPRAITREQCNITFDSAINTWGVHLGGIGLWIGIGAGIDAWIIANAHDTSQWVIAGSLKSGLGLEVEYSLLAKLLSGSLNITETIGQISAGRLLLGGFQASEATLDEVRGVGWGADASAVVIGVSADVSLVPIGSMDCPNASGSLSLDPGSLGANIHLSLTDIIYDSRFPGRLFPNTFMIPD